MPKQHARLWLRVRSVSRWQVLDVDAREAIREGFASCAEFLAAWTAMYGEPLAGTYAWRYGFEVA